MSSNTSHLSDICVVLKAPRGNLGPNFIAAFFCPLGFFHAANQLYLLQFISAICFISSYPSNSTPPPPYNPTS